jgi:hypothetical protein
MQLLQQDKNRPSNFVAVDNADVATHFFDDDGKLHTLARGSFVNNVPIAVEPLPLPVMNFGKDETTDNKQYDSNILPLPVMQF